MKPRLLTIVLLAAVVAVQAQTRLKVGDRAPDFALPNGDGKLTTLSEHTARGLVVVIFYRGFW